MATKNLPTIEYLRQCFRYEDGKLFWLRRPREHFSADGPWKNWNARFYGKEAGCQRSAVGYWVISINDVAFSRHKIIWAMHGGCETEIDHKDRDPKNDRLENLRAATHPQNMVNRNQLPTNRSGYKGVTRKRGRWAARGTKDGKSIHLGMFSTPEEAHGAYLAYTEKEYGAFACSS